MRVTAAVKMHYFGPEHKLSLVHNSAELTVDGRDHRQLYHDTNLSKRPKGLRLYGDETRPKRSPFLLVRRSKSCSAFLHRGDTEKWTSALKKAGSRLHCRRVFVMSVTPRLGGSLQKCHSRVTFSAAYQRERHTRVPWFTPWIKYRSDAAKGRSLKTAQSDPNRNTNICAVAV